MISRLIRKLQHRLSCIAGWTENMEEKKYKAIIEGILFSMGESVELEKIAGTLGLDQKKTKDLIDEMRNEWEEQRTRRYHHGTGWSLPDVHQTRNLRISD